MQRPLQEHIRLLEEHILGLTAQMRRPMIAEEERNRAQAEILIAEQALACFKNGYELEQKVV